MADPSIQSEIDKVVAKIPRTAPARGDKKPKNWLSGLTVLLIIAPLALLGAGIWWVVHLINAPHVLLVDDSERVINSHSTSVVAGPENNWLTIRLSDDAEFSPDQRQRRYGELDVRMANRDGQWQVKAWYGYLPGPYIFDPSLDYWTSDREGCAYSTWLSACRKNVDMSAAKITPEQMGKLEKLNWDPSIALSNDEKETLIAKAQDYFNNRADKQKGPAAQKELLKFVFQIRRDHFDEKRDQLRKMTADIREILKDDQISGFVEDFRIKHATNKASAVHITAGQGFLHDPALDVKLPESPAPATRRS